MATPIGIIQDSVPTKAKPIGTVGPAPQQLRAGTGSFWGDVKQDAANIFLPERFAADIAKQQNPGSEIYQDKDGNWIIRKADGKEYYLNEPGLGVQDALNVTGALALPGWGMAAVGKVAPKAAAALQGLAVSSPLLSGMAAGAGYSAAQQGVGSSLTDQDMSLLEVGEGAVFGGVVPGAQKYGGKGLDALANVTGVEAIRNPIKSALYGIERVFTGSGQLTTTAKEALEAAGIKWQSLTPEQISIANSRTADVLGMNTQAQGRAIGMSTVGINDPTEGMLGQMPDVIKAEAAGVNRRGRETAIQQLRDAGDAMARPDNMESTGNRLVNMYNQDKRAVDASFDAARRTAEQATVPPASLNTLRTRMVSTLEKDLSKDQLEAAMANFPTFKPLEVKNILGPDGKVISSVEIPDPKDIPETIRSLYEWRRDHLGVDATGKAKQAFDAEMERWLDTGLASDLSADGIKAFQAANKEMRKFSQIWNASDTIEKLVTKDKQGYALRIDPEAAANTLLNSSETGFMTRTGLRRDVRKLKELLGEESPEFQALADAMAYKALKLRSGFKEGQRQGSLSVKGTDMKNHWDRVKRENGDVLAELYSPQTLDAFDNFIEYARMMDTRLKDEANVPLDQVSQFLVTILKRMGSATFRFSRAALQEAAERTKEVGAQSALRQFYGDLYIPRGANTPLIAAGEATETLLAPVYDSILKEWGLMDSEPLQIPIVDGVPQP